MARELNAPALCLSQVNRANEKRDDKRPQLSDLRDSGAIEDYADIVMFLYDVGMEIFDNPSFETMSVQERNAFAINERAYRLARRFGWSMEGGELYVSESVQ